MFTGTHDTVPLSPEWHRHLAQFWREEIRRRERRLEEAQGELEAARQALEQHEKASR